MIQTPMFDSFKSLLLLLPKDYFAPINLNEYAAAIEHVYAKKYIPEGATEEQEYSMRRVIAKEIPKDTYFCSFFMPCHH